MPTEVRRPTTWTGTRATGDFSAAPSATAANSSLTNITQYGAVSNGFGTKVNTWTSANLVIVWGGTTNGDGDVTVWNSTTFITYDLGDGSGFRTTGLSLQSGGYGSINGGDSSGSPFAEGPYTETISIPAATNPANVVVKMTCQGHQKTGITPDWVLGSSSSGYITDARIDGTYTAAPTITNLNSNGYCNIGSSYTLNGTNFTGASSVTVNGVSASFSAVTATTLTVTIPVMSSYGTITVGITATGGSASGTGYINTPSIGALTPANSYVTNAASLQFTAGTVSNLASSAITWAASGGSINSSGYFTANTGTGTFTIYSYATGNYPYVYATTTVIVVASPTAGFSVSTTNPLYGATNVTMTTSCTNNSLLYIGNAGYGTSNVGMYSGAIPQNVTGLGLQTGGFITTLTYYVRAFNQAISYQDATTITITPQTVTMGAITNGGPVTVNYTRTLTAGTVGGAVNTNVTWSASGGSFSLYTTASGGNTVWTAPATPGTYTIYNTAQCNGITQSSITITTYALPTASITANKSLALSGDTGVTVTPSGGGDVYWVYIGTSINGAEISGNATNNVAVGVQTGGFTTTTTYYATVFNHALTYVCSTGYTVTLQPAPTFTNNGPVLFGTSVTLTPTFSGTVPTVSPGSWSTWSSGTGQSVTLTTNKLYTLTQSGVGTATTVPQVKLGASQVSLNDVRTITGNGAAESMNGGYVRILTGTSNATQVSFSQLQNTYLSTAYYF